MGSRVFTYPVIIHLSDCANTWSRQRYGMAIQPHLPLDERLLILRSVDQFRAWTSLDDERVCVLCERKFSGRQVRITRTRGGRGFQLHCPSEGCNAGPGQWVYPGNPLVSETAYQDWQRALGALDSRTPSNELPSAA